MISRIYALAQTQNIIKAAKKTTIEKMKTKQQIGAGVVHQRKKPPIN